MSKEDLNLADGSTRVLSCPFSLAIDYSLAKRGVEMTLGMRIDGWEKKEREMICTYIVLHWCASGMGGMSVIKWFIVR